VDSIQKLEKKKNDPTASEVIDFPTHDVGAKLAHTTTFGF
jgi:hypothetical protein